MERHTHHHCQTQWSNLLTNQGIHARELAWGGDNKEHKVHTEQHMIGKIGSNGFNCVIDAVNSLTKTKFVLAPTQKMRLPGKGKNVKTLSPSTVEVFCVPVPTELNFWLVCPALMMFNACKNWKNMMSNQLTKMCVHSWGCWNSIWNAFKCEFWRVCCNNPCWQQTHTEIAHNCRCLHTEHKNEWQPLRWTNFHHHHCFGASLNGHQVWAQKCSFCMRHIFKNSGLQRRKPNTILILCFLFWCFLQALRFDHTTQHSFCSQNHVIWFLQALSVSCWNKRSCNCLLSQKSTFRKIGVWQEEFWTQTCWCLHLWPFNFKCYWLQKSARESQSETLSVAWVQNTSLGIDLPLTIVSSNSGCPFSLASLQEGRRKITAFSRVNAWHQLWCIQCTWGKGRCSVLVACESKNKRIQVA